MTEFHLDDELIGALDALRAAAWRGAADAEEVCAVSRRIAGADPDSWMQHWTTTAGGAWAVARDADGAGHRISALAHYRRAASAYAVAVAVAPYSTEPERRTLLWRRQRACWEAAGSLALPAAERLAIPYAGTALPGSFFPAEAQPGERRPLVIVNQGDGPASSSWALAGAGASERRYHWMTFDGPGQGAALIEQHLHLRSDWEVVMTSVIDAMQARPDVDTRRIAVIGTGRAGYLVARALTGEHRCAAAIADPGVADLATPWIATLPSNARELLADGERDAFDRELHLAELLTPALGTRLASCATAHGVAETSRFALFESLKTYRLGDEAERIATPLLLTATPEGGRWPGQAAELHERLSGTTTLLRLSAASGRDTCPPALRESRIFDWLDDHLG